MVMIALYDTMWIDGNSFDLYGIPIAQYARLLHQRLFIDYITTFPIIVQKKDGNNIGDCHTNFKWQF